MSARKPKKKPFSWIRPGDLFGTCARCEVRFIPDWNESLGCFSRCCPDCQIRNLADAMDWPELAENCGLKPDKFTKNQPSALRDRRDG